MSTHVRSSMYWPGPKFTTHVEQEVLTSIEDCNKHSTLKTCGLMFLWCFNSFASWVIFHAFLSSADFFFKIYFFKKSFKNTIRVSNRLDPFCWSWSVSKLFAKIISRRQNLPLAGKELIKCFAYFPLNFNIYINHMLFNHQQTRLSRIPCSDWCSFLPHNTGPRSAVGNVSGYRCVSDCRSRGREFDPGPVPYSRGDWSWNNFYGHSPPFRWFIQEGLLSVTSESMCTNYWLTACSSLPRKKCG